MLRGKVLFRHVGAADPNNVCYPQFSILLSLNVCEVFLSVLESVGGLSNTCEVVASWVFDI